MFTKTLPIAALSLATLFSVASLQAAPTTSADTYLRVVNNWFEPVQVKEGWISTKTDIVPSGRTLEWTMYTGSISNLLISYYRNGNWQPILGCPYGNYRYGMTVNVSPAPWDPTTPICQQY